MKLDLAVTLDRLDFSTTPEAGRSISHFGRSARRDYPVHVGDAALLFVSYRLALARYFQAWSNYTPARFLRALAFTHSELLAQFHTYVRRDRSLRLTYEPVGDNGAEEFLTPMWKCTDPAMPKMRALDHQLRGRPMPPEGIARMREVAYEIRRFRQAGRDGEAAGADPVGGSQAPEG
jgi:hypothetical protein